MQTEYDDVYEYVLGLGAQGTREGLDAAIEWLSEFEDYTIDTATEELYKVWWEGRRCTGAWLRGERYEY